jgi:hypothetical protein
VVIIAEVNKEAMVDYFWDLFKISRLPKLPRGVIPLPVFAI